MPSHWEFEADFFTFCNCDWGCPCTFNARPTQGNCQGAGVYRVTRGKFGATKLDGVIVVMYYSFPGRIEEGKGQNRLYIDSSATPAQREAVEAIASGKAGGGIFEIFARLTTKSYPTRLVPIELDIKGNRATVRIPGLMEADSDVLTYPDGTVITPILDLPHGIEFKRGTATNAKRWWIRDEEFLASHGNKYAAVAKVKFTEKGCVG